MLALKPIITKRLQGFTLLELVIGLVVFAIALSLFTSLLVPQARQSAEPILQVRSAELAQSLLNEISSKAFDEFSSRVGGSARCNDGVTACSTAGQLGPDNAETRTTYNDVDDYHNLNIIENALGQDISVNGQSLYAGFSLTVRVVYDDDMNGIDDALTTSSAYVGNTKLIEVTVNTPKGDELVFSTFRRNY
jgi:MSHA pilin protein MshD